MKLREFKPDFVDNDQFIGVNIFDLQTNNLLHSSEIKNGLYPLPSPVKPKTTGKMAN